MSRGNNRIITTANREEDLRCINRELAACGIVSEFARFDTFPTKGYVSVSRVGTDDAGTAYYLGRNLAEALDKVRGF